MINLSLIDRAAVERFLPVGPSTLRTRNAPRERAQPVGCRLRAVGLAKGMPGRRSPQTTNTERLLADLEWAVVNGLMTAAEADRAYGRQPPGAGRRRGVGRETFAAWLAGRIVRLSDPTALAGQIQHAQDRALPAAKRRALIREVNRQLWRYSSDYVGQLRAALAEIEEAA